MAALVPLREKVIKPLLAAQCHPERGPKPKNRTSVDLHYDALKNSMRELFVELGMAA